MKLVYSVSMAKMIVLTIAILVPVLPLFVWAGHTIQGFAEAADRAAIYFYFPARLFALVGFVLMFYQFILSARMSFLEHIFSRPKLLGAHRNLGKTGFLLILFHGVLMIVVDYLDFGALIFTWQKLIGMFALFLLIIAVIASWFFKALNFNVQTWRKIHLLAYIAFPLAFVHAITIGLTIRQSRPITVLFAMLFAWYAAIVLVRLFGAARGVLHPANAPARAGGVAKAGPVGKPAAKPAAKPPRPEASKKPATPSSEDSGES